MVVSNTKFVLLYMVFDNDIVKTTGRHLLQSLAIELSKPIAASNGMMIHQMDIDTAFLNATLDEEI
jgi:hypothetical protein